MKSQLSFLGYMLCAVIFSSCVQQQESELFHNTGIVLQKSDFIKGSISINNHFITYEVKESKSMLFDVLVRLDQFEFKTSVNYNTEDIIFLSRVSGILHRNFYTNGNYYVSDWYG